MTSALTHSNGVAAGNIRVVPLGGLGEIGMNCLAIEEDGGILIVDCGVSFPDDDLGIDVNHPDFSWLLARRERISGVFLTHGHEDHIGALPYLLSELEVPVWGPPHALGIARRRLLEHEFGLDEIDFREAHVGQHYAVGPFSIEPVRVAHSIVEASALSIRTAIGTVLHSGDFNFDPDPPDGEPTDAGRLRALGDAGVAMLLSDSTNIDVPERAGSERGVGRALARLVSEAKARVVIGMFASNIQRLILLGEIAVQSGRKLCLFGRSLQTQYTVAAQIGRVSWPSDLLVSAEQAESVPREQLLVLAGGSQAERNSALARLARGQHPALKLVAGDTVVFSSRVIPGNDRPVMSMMNQLLRAGIEVRSRITDPDVHTSGHAGRSEQRQMLELVRPRCFVPVHGTLHHLLRHADLARTVGVHATTVVENGTPVICNGADLGTDDAISHGRISVAIGGETLAAETHQQRAELGRSGLVCVSLALGAKGELRAPPSVSARGVPGVDGSDIALRAIALEAARAVETFRAGSSLPLVDQVRQRARRKVEDISGVRAIVDVQVLEIG